jgi:hypothetical protein
MTFWIDPSTYATSSTVAYPWTTNINYPPQPAMQAGWKCTDCGTVMAPWMAAHRCEPVQMTTTSGTGLLAKGDSDAGEEPGSG